MPATWQIEKTKKKGSLGTTMRSLLLADSLYLETKVAL